jgi:hypothetical protein
MSQGRRAGILLLFPIRTAPASHATPKCTEKSKETAVLFIRRGKPKRFTAPAVSTRTCFPGVSTIRHENPFVAIFAPKHLSQFFSVNFIEHVQIYTKRDIQPPTDNLVIALPKQGTPPQYRAPNPPMTLTGWIISSWVRSSSKTNNSRTWISQSRFVWLSRSASLIHLETGSDEEH